jgi:transcriptional regulator with XRE-family HTH domain
MKTLDQIRAALADRNLQAVAQAAGIHYNTVREVANNKDANPTYKTLKKLSDYLERS